jgi:hypothetical protein
MFTKINAIYKKVDTHSNLQITKYHATNVQLAKSTSRWDVSSIGKFTNINPNAINDDTMIKFSKEILDLSVKKSFDKSVKTFKQALKHDCYHDIIARNEVENTVTVAFLPISTSNNIVPCGIQNFNKIYVNINLKDYKKFYITRLLFHKTMTVLESNIWYQDKKIKKSYI